MMVQVQVQMMPVWVELRLPAKSLSGLVRSRVRKV